MQEPREESSSSSSPSHARRAPLPPLAPRDVHSSSSRDRPSASGSGRPPRLSHRSRAGCWTCRGRKVKCDEVRPRCGPCTRLNRECDWEHRWNFSDATSSTQVKYSNVTTAGNSVWDPHVRESPSAGPARRQADELPEFSVLTNDEERERKAELQRPGTYGVVVTPESFSDLPEYAIAASPGGRRLSTRSPSILESPASSLSRTPSRADPNVIVLDRFEEPLAASSAQSAIHSPARRSSLPEGMQLMSISTSSPPSATTLPTSPLSRIVHTDDDFITRFRHYVVARLVRPQLSRAAPDVMVSGSTKDAFEIEAQRFPPLHHAICAIGALNLANDSQSTLDAMQHYHQALSAQATSTSPDDLHTDGVFFRHFLLFVYDICIPLQDDQDGGGGMWRQHLNHLHRITTLRHERLGGEPHGYIIWLVCELDMYACLLGSGNGDFLRTIVQHNMLPPLHQQIPVSDPQQSGPFLANETAIFPAILHLNQGVVIQTAKLANVAQLFRQEAGGHTTVAPAVYARWQARVSQLQTELTGFWRQAIPAFLVPESYFSGRNLPERVRYVFEHAFMLYQLAVIYSRTSMFTGQRRIPVANQQEINADTERRVVSIVSLAAQHLEAGHLEHRHVIFPLFIAGVATTMPDMKIQALDTITAFERTGIGQNTYRTRQLLNAVYEEQRLVVGAGGRMEDVDWLPLARRRGLAVVNCGL